MYVTVRPLGPTSGLSLLVGNVGWMSTGAGSPAQGCEVPSILTVLAFAVKGWTAFMGMGRTTSGARLEGSCGLGISM